EEKIVPDSIFQSVEDMEGAFERTHGTFSPILDSTCIKRSLALFIAGGNNSAQITWLKCIA
ncbi:MAG: hypothetical protein FWE89_04415, partial [Syntrophaceae bacterium]|nr:hypothetical protein [Syntrophaceae bacterium]